MKIWAKMKEFFEGKFLVVRRDGSTDVILAKIGAAP